MVAMSHSNKTTPFELVLHHNYQQGMARDLSTYGNDGLVWGPTFVAGTPPDPAGLYFDGRDDRIVVFPSETLRNLQSLRVSALIWLEELGQRRNLVEGFISFSLMVESDGSLQAGVYDGDKWNSIWTPSDAISLKQWLYVTFVYNGADTAALYVNRTLAAIRYQNLGYVHSIQWPFGLNIGAWPDANSYVFKGKIAEVKLWRRTDTLAGRRQPFNADS